MKPTPLGELRPSGGAATSDGVWLVVLAAGVAAAMHIWKLPGALALVRDDLSMTLVEAGLLVGVIQAASIAAGLPVALAGEVLGLRRMLVLGLVLLSAGSLLGAVSPGTVLLLASRSVEGVGFLLAVVGAPALIRHVAPPGRLSVALAGWATFHGAASLIGLAAGALVLQAAGWRLWWLVMAVVTLVPVPFILARVPADGPARAAGWRGSVRKVRRTVAAVRPWITGIVFACYTAQWMALMGFLPSIYQSLGLIGVWPGLLSAAVGGANAIGAVAAGPLLQRGIAERRIVLWTFLAMAATSWATFAVHWEDLANGFVLQLLLVAVFSAAGGLVPAALTRYSVTIAPPGGSIPAVLGLTQQIFNVGNFAGPLVIAALATSSGGWHATWWLTCGLSALGVALLPALSGPGPKPRARRCTEAPDLPGEAPEHCRHG
ncbi:CynX/NimT family MFS transporter [Arthrobacter sp. GCM10027362]|uniref:MFS transporter n=1 Tax=Arthrobacter sp. GCM10027362 TaxID=3273379 RepID=UPI00362DFE49